MYPSNSESVHSVCPWPAWVSSFPQSKFWFLVGFQGCSCSSLLWLQSWWRQQDRSVGSGPDVAEWHWACDGPQNASRCVGNVWADFTLLCCSGRHLLLLQLCPYQVKGQRERWLAGRRAAGGEKVALGWWRHFKLRWEPTARAKKVLKEVRIYRAGESRSVQLFDGCVRELLNCLQKEEFHCLRDWVGQGWF